MSRPRAVIEVPESNLQDLRSRLRRTAGPPPRGRALDGGAGTDAAELSRLVHYWQEGYDWRTQERMINALPWHVADLDGASVHYLRFDAEPVADARPEAERRQRAADRAHARLAELGPGARRPRPQARRAFAVEGPPRRRVHRRRPGVARLRLHTTAASLPPGLPTDELWHQLMHDELGFTRYTTHGGDLDAGITSLLAQAHPDALVGIHLLAVAQPIDVDPATITPAEQLYLDAVRLGRPRKAATSTSRAPDPPPWPTA